MTASQLIAKYGPPNRAYLDAECVIWHIQESFPWFPAKVLYINKVFRDMLFVSFTAVEKAGLQHEVTSCDGCYADRPVRGSNSISAHAYAAALDMDAIKGRMFIADGLSLSDPKRLGPWSRAFVQAMTSSGVFFGGFFKHRSDPMHFSIGDI